MDIYGLFSPFGKRLAIKININQSNTYDFETLIGLANILRDLLDVLDEVTSAHFVSVYIALISASKITKWLRRGKMSGGKGVWSRLVTFGHVFKETRDPATRSNLERVYFSNWHTSVGLCLDHP